MKLLVGAIIATFIAGNVATTHIGVEPTLQYDHHYEIDEKNLSNDFLFVVPEQMNFPNTAQKERYERAQLILETVLNSYEFKRRVLSYKRSSDGKRLYQKNYLWNDSDNRLTNEDVFSLVMKGDEFMLPDTIAEMNLYANVKQCNWFMSRVSVWCRKVIGSTNPGQSKWMTLNWKFYKRFKTSEMVSNIVHEWLHLLGFLHGNVNMREEVPYVVGSIAGQVAAEYLAEQGMEN